MASKFTIEIDDDEAPEPGQKARPGPMASAIEETGVALRRDGDNVATARETQTRYAKAYKDLVETEQSVEMIPLDVIDLDHLTRDRRVIDQTAQDELVKSILAVGLSNPIRVERAGEGYRLIQGARRLSAYRYLLDATGQDRYARIPAAVWNESDLAMGYRRMVDENLVRADVSYAELAMLAQAFADDDRTPVGSASDAVDALYASASPAKRSHIRTFLQLLEKGLGMFAHPEAISRNLGLKLVRALDDPSQNAALSLALMSDEDRDAKKELAIIAKVLDGKATTKRGPSARRQRTRTHSFQAVGKTIKISATADRIVIAGGNLDAVTMGEIEGLVKGALQRS